MRIEFNPTIAKKLNLLNNYYGSTDIRTTHRHKYLGKIGFIDSLLRFNKHITIESVEEIKLDRLYNTKEIEEIEAINNYLHDYELQERVAKEV